MNTNESKVEEIRKAVSCVGELKNKVTTLKDKTESVDEIKYTFLPYQKEWVLSFNMEFLLSIDGIPSERISISRLIYDKHKDRIKERYINFFERIYIVLEEIESYLTKAIDDIDSICSDITRDSIYESSYDDKYYHQSIMFGAEDTSLSWNIQYAQDMSARRNML